MARIPLPAPGALSPAQQAVHDSIVNGPRGKIQGPLRAALHNPALAERWQALGALLRYQTSLPPRLSELAILVTARACQSPFEWHVHRQEAGRAGWHVAAIDALLAGQRPEGLSEAEAAVHDVAQQLNQHRSVGDQTYGHALRCLGTTTLVELVALVGYYTMVAMTLNAHEIPLPDGAAPALVLPQRGALQ